MTDQCLHCGRFVGNYPVGFHCDEHCADCTCSQCPTVTFAPRRAPETAPGPGVNLDAGQGAARRPVAVQYAGPAHPAAVTAVPGTVTAHSFTSSPLRAAAKPSDDATETGGDAGGPGNTRRAPGPPAQRSPLQEPARAGRATLDADGGGR